MNQCQQLTSSDYAIDTFKKKEKQTARFFRHPRNRTEHKKFSNTGETHITNPSVSTRWKHSLR